MGPPRPQPTEAEWLRHKATIRRLYLGEEMPLAKLVTEVGNLGLVVTKAQVEYKLKKWEFRRNVDKETWAFIIHNISKRKREGKDSQVIHYGKRLKTSTIEKETYRHRDMTISSHPANPPPSPLLSSPSNMNVAVCTPQPLPMEFDKWPSTLPWFKFQATHFSSLISNSHWVGGPEAGIIKVLQPARSRYLASTIGAPDLQLQLTDTPPQISRLAVVLGKSMPEFYPGENLQRAHALLRGPSQECFSETMAMIIYSISNNLHDLYDTDQWIETVDLLQECGILNIQVDLGGLQDTTVRGFMDNLFSAAIYWLTSGNMSTTQRQAEHAMVVVKRLLSAGQSPNTIVRLYCEPMTPLQAASQSRNLELIEHLLDKGADVNFLPDTKYPLPLELTLCTPRYYYGTSVASRIAKLLLMHGASRNLDRALCLAIENSNSELAIAILHQGAEHCCDLNLGHALCLAIENSNSELAIAILHQGAEHCRDLNLGHALCLAIENSDSELAIAILHQGAEHCRDLNLDRALRLAINKSNRTLALAILQHGASLRGSFNPPNGFLYEETALSAAAAVGKKETEFVLLLLASEYPSNPVANFITADVLISAAAAANDETIRLLYGIQSTSSLTINFANHFGITPLHVAASNGHLSTCQLLLQLYDSHTEITGYISPLHLACYSGHNDVVQWLLDNGANVNDLAAVGDACKTHALRYSPSVKNWLHPCLTPLGMLLDVFPCRSKHLDCAATLVKTSAILTGCEIVLAGEFRHAELLSAALAAGGNPDETEPQGSTALQVIFSSWSYSDRDLTCATLLIEKGATLRGGDVIDAIHLGNLDLVNLLLSHGGCLTETDKTGTTALEAAIMSKTLNLVDAVFEAHPDVYDAGSLCAAIMHKMDLVVERLLANRPFQAQSNVLEATAIGLATRWGDLALLRKLLGYMPHSNVAMLPFQADFYGNLVPDLDSYGPFWRNDKCLKGSPLALAVDNSVGISAWRLLLESGYRADRLTWMVIAREENLSMAQDLLDSYQRLSDDFLYHGSPRLRSPLIDLIESHNKALVVLLLEAGADVNEHDRGVPGSRSPLQLAVEIGDLDIVDCLLKAGAEVNAPPANDGGGTALQLAAIKSHLGLVKLLLDLGAHVNAIPSFYHGRTAIEGAAEYGRIDMLEFLLHHGDFATDIGRRQYVKAVKRAATRGYSAAAELLRGYRDWVEEDEELFNDEDILEEDDWMKYMESTGYYEDEINEENNSGGEYDSERWDESGDKDKSADEYEMLEGEFWIPAG